MYFMCKNISKEAQLFSLNIQSIWKLVPSPGSYVFQCIKAIRAILVEAKDFLCQIITKASHYFYVFLIYAWETLTA